MSIAQVKQAAANIVQQIPNVGTVDLKRLDADSLPRRIATQPAGKPYWAVTVGRAQSRIAAFGTTDCAVWRDYRVRVEGWLGFVGVDDKQDEWEQITQLMLDHFDRRRAQAAQSISGFYDWTPAIEMIDIVELRNGTRAHHVLIEVPTRAFERVVT